MIEIQETTSELERLVEAVTFDPSRLGVSGRWTPSTLRSVFDGRSAQFNWQSVALVVVRTPDSELTRLTEVLEAQLANYVVDGRIGNGFVNWFGGTPTLTVAELARGTVRAAAILGPERAARLLNVWSRENRARGRDCAIGYGISLAEPVHLSAGVHFEMLFETQPVQSRLGAFFPGANWWRFAAGDVWEENPFRVEVDFEISPVLFRPGEGIPTPLQTWTHGQWLNDHIESVFDALTLHLDQYVSWNAVWWEFRDLTAFGLCKGVLYRGRSDNMHRYGARKVTHNDLAQSVQLFIRHVASSDRRLDMAIARWVKSKRPYAGMADRFIDLRTAMELLYLDDAPIEMRFRLATHGAWYLGADFTERREYQRTLRDAYDAASKAVHTGEVKGNEAAELLTTAQSLCRRGILRRLDQGCTPTWNDVILGKNAM